jgi:2-oxoglutarate ferredoxin oxidoreductase subunit alpha
VSAQEAYEMTALAFDLADKYRTPVMLLGDGALGQMMEKVELKPIKPLEIPKPWAVTGRHGRADGNTITSLILKPEELEAHNLDLQKKYREISEKETLWEEKNTADADLVLVAYGIMARIAQSAMDAARESGLKVGMFRPKTLWPFPSQALMKVAGQAKAFLVLELSAGQMIEDVRLSIEHKKPVSFYGRTGGMIPKSKEVLDEILSITGLKGERLK